MRFHYAHGFITVVLTVTMTIATGASPPADSLFKSWYYTPGGVFGRQPLDHPRSRYYVRITRPSSDLAVIANINPAGLTTNTTRIYFRNGLIALSTETDRWGNTYDSTWFNPDGPDKFLVTQRIRGVNPYLPCKYVEYIFRDNLLAGIVCYIDSIRAGSNQEGVGHYVFDRYTDPGRRGLIRTETFLTEIDAPAFSRIADCHKVVNEYDSKGDLITRSIYGSDDKPLLDRNGIFRTRYKYDGDDNQTAAEYFDTNDKTTLTGFNYSQAYRDYHRGFLREESFCVDLNMPAVSTQLGRSVSFVDHKYDEEGNETETTWFDRDHDPVNNIRNLQKIEYHYAANGLLTQEDQLSIDRNGESVKVYLTQKYTRDERGRILEQHYETNTGTFIPNFDNGANFTKYTYDAWGRIHSTSYWQNDSTRMISRYGYHEFVNRYDSDGQLAERQFYDEHGALSVGAIGYSREVILHNALGQPAEISYFANGKPVMLAGKGGTMAGFHRVVYGYDQLNRRRSMEFSDTAGRPVKAFILGRKSQLFKAGKIDFDYSGDLLMTETLQDTANGLTVTTLDCAKGECLSFYGVGTFEASALSFNPTIYRTYHGHLRADTIFDNQLGLVGPDSLLTFISGNWRDQTELGCAEYYRLATVNKYYQLDGHVTDYYMANDSVAASLNYLGGKLEGPVYLYYPNGVVRERGNYHDDVRAGIWEYYYDNGQKERTLVYLSPGQPPVLQDSYSRNGDVLAQNGNGRFEGPISPPHWNRPYELIAKGNVLNGLPDGEWNLYTRDRSGPANTEYFAKARFRHGISYTMLGKSTYEDHFLSGFESEHRYESLDHYDLRSTCRPEKQAPFQSDIYEQLRAGFTTIGGDGQYRTYSGWVFLAVRVDSSGHVLGSSVRLHEPNAALENDIRQLVSRLNYPPSHVRGGAGHPYEKLYIILLSNNALVIPEELLERQRNLPIDARR